MDYTQQDVDRILDASEKITDPPWVIKKDEWGIKVQCKDSPSGLPFAVTPICEIEQEEDDSGLFDATLIAGAPILAEEVKRLRAENDELRSALMFDAPIV